MSVREFVLANDSGNGDARARLRERLARNDMGPVVAESTGWVDWDRARILLGQPFDATRIALPKLYQMRRDPMLSFGLMFLKVPMVRSPWYVKCSDAQVADFVDHALRAIWGRLVFQFTNAYDFGYSAVVKRFYLGKPTWTYLDKEALAAGDSDPERKTWDRGVDALLWKPFVALRPEKVEPSWNASGEFNGIAQKGTKHPGVARGPGQPPVDIRLPWALWFTNGRDSEFNSMYGYPRTAPAYRYWWSYWFQWAQMDRSFERWADPPLMGYHPVSGIDDVTGQEVDYSGTMLDVLAKLRSGAAVSLPSTPVTGLLDERTTTLRAWEIKPLEHNVNFGAMRDWADYMDIQKLRALTIPEQALAEGRGGSSSRNVAEEFGQRLMEMQAVSMAELDDEVNRHVIPQLVALNFGPDAPEARKVTTGFDRRDTEAMREMMRLAGQRMTPDRFGADLRAVMEYLGIPVMAPGEIRAAMEREVIEAEKAPRPSIPARVNEAGTTELGQYYDGRERIELASRLMRDQDILELAERVFQLTGELKLTSERATGAVLEATQRALEATAEANEIAAEASERASRAAAEASGVAAMAAREAGESAAAAARDAAEAARESGAKAARAAKDSGAMAAEAVKSVGVVVEKALEASTARRIVHRRVERDDQGEIVGTTEWSEPIAEE